MWGRKTGCGVIFLLMKPVSPFEFLISVFFLYSFVHSAIREFSWIPLFYLSFPNQFPKSIQLSSLYSSFFFFFNFWLHWVFVAACGLSLVVLSGCYSSLWCAGFSLQWLLLLRSQALGMQASVVVVCGLSSCGSRALEHRLSSCGTRA